MHTHIYGGQKYVVPYHTDELGQRDLQLHCDSLCPVDSWADERIVAILSQ